MTPRRPTVGTAESAGLDHQWMSQATCVRRADLPWTEDAHRVEDEVREVMARVCQRCPVRGCCRRYATDCCASAGFWAGGFRGAAYTGDLLDLVAELDEDEVRAHCEPHARRAGFVHRRALAS